MLRRKPTRIEMKEDEAREELKAAQAARGRLPEKNDDRKQLSVEARIGLVRGGGGHGHSH